MPATGSRVRLSPRDVRPPPGYCGDFLTDTASLEAATVVSGPFALLPLAVARPLDVAALVALVRWAGETGLPLVPRGAGTGMPGGNVGRGVVIDLGRWDEVAEAVAEDGVLRVGPGALGRAIDGHRWSDGVARGFPALPSSADRCTVGGMIANNAAGARSFRHGAVRPWVDALDVVFADGTVERLERGSEPEGRFARLRGALTGMRARAHPPPKAVTKNASGYAVDAFLTDGAVDLIVGSEGTLGIVCGARVRTLVTPEREGAAVIPIPHLADLDGACARVRAIGATACEFLGGRFLDMAGIRGQGALRGMPDADAVLLVQLEGGDDEVEGGFSGLAALADDLGVRIAEARAADERERLWAIRHAASPVVARRAREGQVSMQFIEDCVVPPGRLAAYLVGLNAILDAHATDAVVFGHAGDGNVHVNPLIDVRRPGWRGTVGSILDRTAELVAELGGTLSGEHGDGRVRAPYLECIWGTAAVEEFRTIRAALDPSGILNPGVVLPLPGQDPLDGLTPRPRTA